MKGAVALMALLTLGSALAEGTALHSRVITATAEGRLQVWNGQNGGEIASFDTAGKAGLLQVGARGRLVYLLHPAENRVTVLDSGLYTVGHGDHDDIALRRPSVLATLNAGEGPSGLLTSDDGGEAWVGVIAATEGAVVLMPEDLVGVTNEMKWLQLALNGPAVATLHAGELLAINAAGDLERFSAEGELIGKAPACASPLVALSEEAALFMCEKELLSVSKGQISRMNLPQQGRFMLQNENVLWLGMERLVCQHGAKLRCWRAPAEVAKALPQAGGVVVQLQNGEIWRLSNNLRPLAHRAAEGNIFGNRDEIWLAADGKLTRLNRETLRAEAEFSGPTAPYSAVLVSAHGVQH